MYPGDSTEWVYYGLENEKPMPPPVDLVHKRDIYQSLDDFFKMKKFE